MRQEIAHPLQDSVPLRPRRARGFSGILELVPVGKQLPELTFHFCLASLQRLLFRLERGAESPAFIGIVIRRSIFLQNIL